MGGALSVNVMKCKLCTPVGIYHQHSPDSPYLCSRVDVFAHGSFYQAQSLFPSSFFIFFLSSGIVLYCCLFFSFGGIFCSIALLTLQCCLEENVFIRA